MRRKLVAGNWKMYGDKAMVAELLVGIKHLEPSVAECVVFPPYVFLPQVAQALADSSIHWGAQNVSANEPGAYTGEIAANMLVEFGCRYVLVGHSERRRLYHESDAEIALKFAQAKHHGLRPILCVGETSQQRENGETEQVIERQIGAVLELADKVAGLQQAVIAYEPVWAIGTGHSATPDQAQQVHALIRQKIAQLDPTIAQAVPILYGGSVKASNAADLFAMSDVDGSLVGGASLDADEFIKIVQCIS